MSAKYDDLRLGDYLGTSLHDAALRGNKRQLKKIIKKGIHVDYPNSHGQTALYVACSEGHEDLAAYLLKKGADPNVRTDDGSTAVHAAGLGGSTRVISLLIAAGGDLRLHDKEQRTISEWAATLSNVKKRKKVQNFINKIRNAAITHTGRDVLFERHSSSFYSSLHDDSTIGGLFKGKSSSKTLSGMSLQNLGFGKVCYNNDLPMGALATIPLVRESGLKHDQYGFSYNNGPFMVMESMFWKCTQVTVKRLHRKPPVGGMVDLLIKENHYMSTLRHPSILLLMGVCQTNQLDDLVLLYERVGCGSLYHYLYQKAETFAVWSMCELLRQVCDAVVYLHERNLIHSNISSHSIHVISPAVAKLGNFEYVTENSGHMSPDGTFPKTDAVNNKYLSYVYNWLAPEIMDGESPTEVSDLYSLCVVIWEILNGSLPWRGLDADEIRCEVVDKRNCLPVDRDKIESPFDIILQQGLSVFPGNRLITVEKLRDHMARVVVDREHISISQRSITPCHEIDDVVDLSISRMCDSTALDISKILDASSKTLTPTPAPRRSRSSTPASYLKRKVSKVEKKEWTPEHIGEEGDRAAPPKPAERLSVQKKAEQVLSEVHHEPAVQVDVVAVETIPASSPDTAEVTKSDGTSSKKSRKKRQSKESGERRRSWVSRKEKKVQEQINDVVASDSDGPQLVAISSSSLNKQQDSSHDSGKTGSSPRSRSKLSSSQISAASSTQLRSAARKSLFQGAIPFRSLSARVVSSSSGQDSDRSDRRGKISKNASTTSSSLLTMPQLTSTSTTQESQENTVSIGQDVHRSTEKTEESPRSHQLYITSPGSDNPFRNKQLSAEAESTIKQLQLAKPHARADKISKAYSALSAVPHRRLVGALEKHTVFGALSRQDISVAPTRWHRSPSKEAEKRPAWSHSQSGLGGSVGGLQRQSSIFNNLQVQLEEGRAPTSADILPPHLKNRSMPRRTSWVMEAQPVCYQPGSMKPASHRQSLEGSPSKPPSTETTQSICSLDTGDIVWQDASEYMAGITQSVDRHRTMPHSFTPVLGDAHQFLPKSKQSWQKFRSETYLDLGGRRGFSLDLRDTHHCLSSASMGARHGAEGEVITSSGGSIKDLIKAYQDHEMQHKQKQSILCLKKKDSDVLASAVTSSIKRQPSSTRSQMIQTENQAGGDGKQGAYKALAEVLAASAKVQSEQLVSSAAPKHQIQSHEAGEMIPGSHSCNDFEHTSQCSTFVALMRHQAMDKQRAAMIKSSEPAAARLLSKSVAPSDEKRSLMSSVCMQAQELVADVLSDLEEHLDDEKELQGEHKTGPDMPRHQVMKSEGQEAKLTGLSDSNLHAKSHIQHKNIDDEVLDADDHISYHSTESEDEDCHESSPVDGDVGTEDADQRPAGGRRLTNGQGDASPNPDDYYFDDVISPDLYNQRYMRLQTTMGLNGSELDSPNLTPIHTSSGVPHTSFLPTTEEDETTTTDQHSDRSNQPGEEGFEGSRYRGPHTFPAEPETMTLTQISPASTATAASDEIRIIPSGETVTIEKVVDVRRDRGSNTQLTVASRDDGSCIHTISCSKTDMTTGTTVTTQKKITAQRVITKVVALDDSFTEV